jgi:hypothetical protein
VPNQFSDVRQGWKTSHGLFYAARSKFFDKLVATFHGSSSSICLMG